MRRVLAWALWVASVIQSGFIGLAVVLFPAIVADTSPTESASLAIFFVAVAVVVLAFATGGFLIVRHVASHAVGWVMLAGGPTLGAVFVGYVLGFSLLGRDNGTAGWLVLVATVLFAPAIFLVGPSLAMLFPDGRFLSGWWRSIFLTLAALVAVSALLMVLAPGPLEDGLPLVNPVGIPALPAGTREVASALSTIALSVGGLMGIAALVVRYRGADSDVRHQLKWFTFAVAIWVAVLPFSFGGDDNWLAVITLIGLALVPASVLVAILRYRLYEIDTLINRALVYFPLVGIVAGLYAASVALLQRLFVSVTGDTSDAVGVVSALVLAAVFTPIRNTLQAIVDRRFKPETDLVADPAWSTPEFEAAVERILVRLQDRHRLRDIERDDVGRLT